MSPPLDHFEGTASTDNNENVMNSLTSEFEAIKLALPDPESELFHQYLNKLETFHPFPKLPLELRTVIWRYAFPRGRKVLYDRGDWRPYDCHDVIKYCRYFTQPPAVFLANKESRAIALSAYIRILPHNPNCRAVTYLHLDLDTFVIKETHDIEDLGYGRAHSDPVFMETLAKIQYLEISNSDPMHLTWCGAVYTHLEDPQWWDKITLLFPIQFKNLQKLFLGWPKNLDPLRKHCAGRPYGEWLEKLRDDFGPALKSWFEYKRETTGDYKVPEITFGAWRSGGRTSNDS
jgi:hypothetical protein